MAIPDHPNNRKERYLAKIAGQAGATIPAHPHTREEMYLEAIAEGGGGGGGGGTLYRHAVAVTFDDPGGGEPFTARGTLYTSTETAFTVATLTAAISSGTLLPVVLMQEDARRLCYLYYDTSDSSVAFLIESSEFYDIDITSVADTVTEV